MFRPMKRAGQALPDDAVEEILKNGTHGILSVMGDDGYPYGVPLSYVWADGKILFHCGKKGHKVDAIRKNDKVSFTVVGSDEVKPADRTTWYSSVILFGRARIIEDPDEAMKAHLTFAMRYSGDYPEAVYAEAKEAMPATLMVEIRPEHITGKEALELSKRRK